MVLSAGASQDNLFGTDESASAHVSHSKTTISGSLSFTDPYFTLNGVSFGYDVYGKSCDPYKAPSNTKRYKATTAGANIRMGIPITEYDHVDFSLAAGYLATGAYTDTPKYHRDLIGRYGKGNGGMGSLKDWLYRDIVG